VGANTALRLTSGDKNTFIGYAAGQNVTSGDHSVMVGYNCGEGTTGSGNIFVGSEAGQGTVTGGANYMIGYRCKPSADDINNCIGIGENITVSALDFSFGNASTLVTNDYDTDANWSRSSDERIKRNINDDTLGLDFINDLRTVTYQWRPSNEIPPEMTTEYTEGENMKNLDAVMHGFIAQEVKAALDKAGVDTFAGWKLDEVDGVTQRTSREMFVMPLIKAVQELSAKVTALENA